MYCCKKKNTNTFAGIERTVKPKHFNHLDFKTYAIFYLIVLANFRVTAKVTSSPKTYFNGLYRRFAFPPKTFLIFIPEITLPAWRDRILTKRSDDMTCNIKSKEAREEDPFAVTNSDIQIASPFYVYFDKLGWTHPDSIFNTPTHAASFIEEFLLSPARDIFGVPPPPEAVMGKRNRRTDAPMSTSHRLQLFHKIESLLEETFGVANGKACLLRAICELHESRFNSGNYGIFGEILFLIFGTLPPTMESKGFEGKGCLSVYAIAEKRGKVRDCAKYTKYCEYSIYQWHWKVSNTKRYN